MSAIDTPSPPTPPVADPAERPSRMRFFKVLGPGVVTGAADDDPSGIGTYSQAGAQLGFAISWTMLLTYPLMVAIQEISARVGRTTGKGIASNIREHYPAWLLYLLVALLFAANVINIGADLAAMGDADKLLVGGPTLAYVIVFGIICAAAQIYMDYERYTAVLKWACLVLFLYVAALLAVRVPWARSSQGPVYPFDRLDFRFLHHPGGDRRYHDLALSVLLASGAGSRGGTGHPQRQPLIRMRWQAPARASRASGPTRRWAWVSPTLLPSRSS